MIALSLPDRWLLLDGGERRLTRVGIGCDQIRGENRGENPLSKDRRNEG